MAQPIAFEVPVRNPREELAKRLEEAPIEHAEALLDSYELLQQLHEHGVFELLRGGLGASDTLIESVVDAAKSEEAVRGIRNAIIVTKILGAIDPDVLQAVALATTATLGCQKPVIEPPGLFALLSQFRHPELRRSMALINKFLRTLGTELKSRGECK